MDLIDEIIKRGATQEGSVTEMLRLAQIAASKLGAPEIETWIDKELSGYTSISDLPNYRRLQGELRAFSPYQGWIPVTFKDPKTAEAASNAPTLQSIGSLEELYNSNKNSDIVLQLPPTLKKILIDSLRLKTDVQLRLSGIQIYGIIDAVRSRVFSWVVELSRAGVVGDNLKFSNEEVQAATSVIQNFHIGDQANIGSIGFAGRDMIGSNAPDIDIQKANTFLSQVVESAKAIPGERGAEIVRIAEETQEGIYSGEIALSDVRSNLVRIREIAENMIGNLIAGGIAAGIRSILG